MKEVGRNSGVFPSIFVLIEPHMRGQTDFTRVDTSDLSAAACPPPRTITHDGYIMWWQHNPTLAAPPS